MFRPSKRTFKIFFLILLIFVSAFFATFIPPAIDILDIKLIAGLILSAGMLPYVLVSKLGLGHPDAWFPNIWEISLVLILDIIILYIVSAIISFFISKHFSAPAQ